MTIEFPPLSEEKQVILAAQNGDRAAAGTLYEWYGDHLYRRVILPRLPVVDQAEDVLRDAFRIVFERIEQFTPKDRSIFFWLRRIAINLVVDTYRRQVKKRRIADNILARDAIHETMSAAPASPDQGLYDRDARALIEESLTRINARYAKALRLRLLEDRSRGECAEAFEVSVGAFDVLFHRACKALGVSESPLHAPMQGCRLGCLFLKGPDNPFPQLPQPAFSANLWRSIYVKFKFRCRKNNCANIPAFQNRPLITFQPAGFFNQIPLLFFHHFPDQGKAADF